MSRFHPFNEIVHVSNFNWLITFFYEHIIMCCLVASKTIFRVEYDWLCLSHVEQNWICLSYTCYRSWFSPIQTGTIQSSLISWLLCHLVQPQFPRYSWTVIHLMRLKILVVSLVTVLVGNFSFNIHFCIISYYIFCRGFGIDCRVLFGFV